MRVEITTGDLKVVNSGTVLLKDKNSNLQLSLEADNGYKFAMEFLFKDTEREEYTLNSFIENDVLKIICTNFNNQLGTGSIEPLEIATIAGKKLFLHFWVFALSNCTKKVEYNLLMEV